MVASVIVVRDGRMASNRLLLRTTSVTRVVSDMVPSLAEVLGGSRLSLGLRAGYDFGHLGFVSRLLADTVIRSRAFLVVITF